MGFREGCGSDAFRCLKFSVPKKIVILSEAKDLLSF